MNMKNYNRNQQMNPQSSSDEMKSQEREPAYGSPYDFRQGIQFNYPSRYYQVGDPAFRDERISALNIDHDNPYSRGYNDYGRQDASHFPESGVNRDQRGLHSGKGPRSYKRPDERIHELACERLCDDSYIDASDIEIAVKDCEVVLTGFVHDRQSKRRAEDLIDLIPGVVHIENRIRVKDFSESQNTSQ
jgi:hypothetical protein